MEKLSTLINYKFTFGEQISISVKSILVLIFVLLITHFILRFIRIIATKKLDEDDKNRFKTVFTFLKYIIFSVVIVSTLDSSGVKITALIAASTALFVGVGLGMQKLFQDIISGIFILIDRTVTVNDIIEINNKVGKITQVSLRTTKAITNDDKILVIPNHKFLSEILYNWTQNDVTTRESVSVGVAYGTDVDMVKAMLLGIAMQEDAILNSPEPNVFFEDFGDSALQFRLHFYIRDSFNVPLIKSQLRYKIYNTFKENSIEIPFPQRDIHIKSK
ncbi:mechanosensitive ion channel domain-containing protein [Winogradskyella sp.]|jgi:small-conductance mechanosensitive channel|uniref:mechanosensitive ion channel family protein n=1 Tax=Winogradskyella sp. TaxID=1883156 RepID=UPI0025D523F4|nr:mechanosensitive ion channel domain-containing protein [Winogradskyella sp.]MCT4629014.1 mechanosensitive ion channel [Winogradskyella sp.]